MRSLKILSTAITSCLIVFCLSCSDDGNAPDANALKAAKAGDTLTFNLPYQEKKFITGVNATFYFDAVISDSRCPVDLICIWAGEVEARIDIFQGNALVDSFNIKNTSQGHETVLNARKYLIQLVDVHPYPGQSGGDKKTYATLRVTKK